MLLAVLVVEENVDIPRKSQALKRRILRSIYAIVFLQPRIPGGGYPGPPLSIGIPYQPATECADLGREIGSPGILLYLSHDRAAHNRAVGDLPDSSDLSG
jgi:hypothetical protein